jgi:hypothetical protein
MTTPLLEHLYPSEVFRWRPRLPSNFDDQILAELRPGPAIASDLGKRLGRKLPGMIHRLRCLESAGLVRQAGTTRPTGRGPWPTLWALADRTGKARGP